MPEATARQYHRDYNVDPTSALSSSSCWGDVRWSLDNPTAGASTTVHTCRWDFDLPDGSCFTDPQHLVLLDSMKRLIWSLFTDNRARRNLKPGNLGWLASGLRFFVRWMVASGLSRVDQFDETAGALYLHDVEAPRDVLEEEEVLVDVPEEEGLEKLEVDPDQDLTFGQAYLRLSVPLWLYQQRDVFREAAIEPPPRHPYNGQEVKALARHLVEQEESKVFALPADIALPILQAAQRLLDQPAEDIIRLQTLYLAIRNRRSQAGERLGSVSHAKITGALSAFEFSSLHGETEPWRAPIPVSRTERRVGSMAPYGQPEALLGRGALVAALIKDTVSAGLIVLQAFTGMRVSEIAGLDGGIDPSTGWPRCVVVRSSKTGLNDVFYIRGRLFKMTESSRDAEWLCGMRPKGSSYVPPVVHAVMVVERLMRPWRALSGREELFVRFSTNRGLPQNASSVNAPSTISLLFSQKRFVAQHVIIDWHALPDRDMYRAFRVRGAWALRTHQWRKTYAHFMFAVDQSSLPLIAQQFKHMSLAMTEQGYLGNDPELLEMALQTRLGMTTRTFYEAIQGERLTTGAFARLIAEHRDSLTRITVGKSREDGMRALEAFVVRHDLRLWFQDHGKCAIAWRPLAAACHREAGTESSRNKTPNWSTRRPGLCSGCGCWFTDPEHRGFWRTRYIELRKAVLAQQGQMPEGPYHLILLRTQQAGAWLRAINEVIPGDAEVLNGAREI